MRNIIILQNDETIKGKDRVKGEVVVVDSNFPTEKIKKVLKVLPQTLEYDTIKTEQRTDSTGSKSGKRRKPRGRKKPRTTNA